MAGASLGAARRHFYPGMAGASQLASFLVPRVPALLVAATLAPGDAYTFTALMALLVEPDVLSKVALALLLVVLAYVVAIPFGAALGPAANRAAKAVSNGACAEVVARKVSTVRWAAAAHLGVRKVLSVGELGLSHPLPVWNRGAASDQEDCLGRPSGDSVPGRASRRPVGRQAES